jgi:excisionase family DNA binding protein
MTQQFFRVREMAEMLGISRASAYRLVSQGDLPSVTVAGTIRVHRSAAEEFVGRLLAQPESPGNAPSL